MDLLIGGFIMVWDVLNVIGTIAFAISGAITAMKVKYDIIGIYILGLITAFGGGAVRNLLTGIPISQLWQQTTLFIIALITITIVFLLPEDAVHRLNEWNLFDAIGLSAFSVQGGLQAHMMNLPLLATMFSAAITGAGGGIIRDVLANQKPMVFRKDIYIFWGIIAGFIIGMGWAEDSYLLYAIFVMILILRIASHRLGWRLPARKINKLQGN
jgi:uncharacterized membrane protein YeiH